MSAHVIELIGTTVRKGKGLLLNEINLAVSQGELVGIIGPNGAGKSTLLNVRAGLERFEGALNLFGRGETWKRSRETRLRVGYVPQSFRIDPAFPIRVREAVMTGVTGRTGLFHSPATREKERAERLLDLMRLTDLAERPLGRVSGGELQKVSLARAILQGPDILLMDEPTAGLDIAVQREVLNLVNEIHEREPLTLLFVTHDFTMLPTAMSRAVLLDRGSIVFDGDIGEALSGETLSSLFQYPLDTFEKDGRRFISYG